MNRAAAAIAAAGSVALAVALAMAMTPWVLLAWPVLGAVTVTALALRGAGRADDYEPDPPPACPCTTGRTP